MVLPTHEILDLQPFHLATLRTNIYPTMSLIRGVVKKLWHDNLLLLTNESQIAFLTLTLRFSSPVVLSYLRHQHKSIHGKEVSGLRVETPRRHAEAVKENATADKTNHPEATFFIE